MSHAARTVVVGLSTMVGRAISLIPALEAWDEPYDFDPGKAPGKAQAHRRAKSSHKQNARRQRKARK
jgi:hypothetical protein